MSVEGEAALGGGGRMSMEATGKRGPATGKRGPACSSTAGAATSASRAHARTRLQRRDDGRNEREEREDRLIE